MTDRIGRVSSESVYKATRKHWDEWIELLKKDGAQAWSHREITEHLGKKYRLGPWWQQGVAIGFETAVGLREEGRNSKGEISMTVTKSLRAPAPAVWKELLSRPGMEIWLKLLFSVRLKAGVQFETTDGFFGELRTWMKQRRLRLYWQDPSWPRKTVVQITLVARPKNRSILVIDQLHMTDQRIVDRMRKRWREAVERLSKRLTED